MIDEKPLLTTAELAAKLRYHPVYVRHLAATGKLPAVKRGRAWLFDEVEVLRYLHVETEKNASGDSQESSLLR